MKSAKNGRWRHEGGRVGRTLLGAALGCALASAVDAAWSGAWRAHGITGGLTSIGVGAPIGALVGALVAVASVVLFAGHAPTPASLAEDLRARAVGRPADFAAFVPLATLGALFWSTLSAQIARAALALDASAPTVGVAMAIGAAGAGLLVSLVVLALVPTLRVALATASDGRPGFVDPAKTLVVGLVLAAGLFAFGVASGSVSGDGGFFGIWGIFKRPELDLRAPGLALATALAGLYGPHLLARVPAPLCAGLAVLPLALVPYSSRALNQSSELASVLERDAPQGKLALAALRKITDRDRDGASAMFGGGDCDDKRADVGPLGVEAPDNGVDEDCSGSDLTAAGLAAVAPKVARPKTENALAGVPEDLSIVLITVDTLRWDLGYAGNPRKLSPNLDALAARSAVFERAYSLASYTGKSVGPMLIGKYGSETHRNWGHFNKFDADDTFVAERLQKAGLRTMAVHGHRYFGKWGGLERGIAELDMQPAPPEGAPWDKDDTATSQAITDRAIALLESPETQASKRFFLWAHYLDPHADYLKHDDVPSFGTDQRALYDGEVAFTDKHIGRLLDALAASPFGKKTVVIVTSDHGEAFGEHKMYRHGFEVWEELVRVPLVIHVPGAPPTKTAARRSAIDLVPTILELARVPAPPAKGATGDDFVSGESLVPDIVRKPGEPEAERDVLVDMPAGPYNDARRAFIAGDLKLIVSNAVKYELYDLASDPGEKKDLYGNADAKQKIMPRYEAMKARMREIKVTGARK